MCSMQLLIGACSRTLAAVHVRIGHTLPPLKHEELGANVSHELTVGCPRAYVFVTRPIHDGLIPIEPQACHGPAELVGVTFR